MSLPTLPDISPDIDLDRCNTIHLLLSSIAMEEIALSHILNAEGEKLQAFLKTCPNHLQDYLKINDNINQTLRTVVKSQILLQFKLENIMELDDHSDCDYCQTPKKKSGPTSAAKSNKNQSLYPNDNKHSNHKCDCKKCNNH